MSKLLDANGRPWPGPLDAMTRDGVRDMGDRVEISKDALAHVMRERARRLAVTSVPSTPRHMLRDAGGVAVAKGHGRWPAVTMELLREKRYMAPILQPIHQARQYQIRRLSQPWPGKPGTVGLRVVHKNHIRHHATQPESIQPFIARFERLLWSPAPSYGYKTLGNAVGALMEDLLTLNRPVVEKIPSVLDPRRIVQWQPVDGATIWPTLMWVEKWKAENPQWSVGYDVGRLSDEDTLDIVSASLEHDLFGAEYCLVREGILEAVYPPDRLIVNPIRNVTDIRFAGYPPSHVEVALSLISAFISTFDYNASYFTKGMLAEFILGLPADLHDDDVDAFVNMFREATQGVAWRPPIIPLPHGKDTITKIDLKGTNTEMGFEIWLSLLVALCTAVYRMHPSTVNAKTWDGGQKATISEGNETAEIGLAQEEGLQGDMQHLIEGTLNELARTCHPDLIVIAEYGNFDPQKEAQIYEIRGRTDLSRNEIRIERGEEPWGFFLTPSELKTASPEDQAKHNDNPWNWPTDPTFANAISAAKQREQQEKMMAMGQQPGGQGQGPDADGYDDGFGGKNDGFGGNTPQHDPAPYGVPGASGTPAPMQKAVTVLISRE